MTTLLNLADIVLVALIRHRTLKTNQAIFRALSDADQTGKLDIEHAMEPMQHE